MSLYEWVYGINKLLGGRYLTIQEFESATMPLTKKGKKIKKAMKKTYGSEKKAKQVLYASKNKGRIKGID